MRRQSPEADRHNRPQLSQTAAVPYGTGLASRRRQEPIVIRKIGGKYVVLSETTGRKFGTYATKAEAEKRLRQIEFFKHLKARSGARAISPRRRA